MWCRLHPHLLCCYGYLNFLWADSRWKSAMNVQILFFFTASTLLTCDSAPQHTCVKSTARSNTLNNLQCARPKHLNSLWSSVAQYKSSLLVWGCLCTLSCTFSAFSAVTHIASQERSVESVILEKKKKTGVTPGPRKPLEWCYRKTNPPIIYKVLIFTL